MPALERSNMKVFEKISIITNVDENGTFWLIQEVQPRFKNCWKFIPSWSVRLNREDLWELAILFLTEIVRLPIRSDNPSPGKE